MASFHRVHARACENSRNRCEALASSNNRMPKWPTFQTARFVSWSAYFCLARSAAVW